MAKRRRLEGEQPNQRAKLTLTQIPSNPLLADMFTRGSHPFRDILFAIRCFCVEVIRDYRFFSGLFEECSSPYFKDITVIEMCGAGGAVTINEFCQDTETPYVIWLD